MEFGTLRDISPPSLSPGCLMFFGLCCITVWFCSVWLYGSTFALNLLQGEPFNTQSTCKVNFMVVEFGSELFRDKSTFGLPPAVTLIALDPYSFWVSSYGRVLLFAGYASLVMWRNCTITNWVISFCRRWGIICFLRFNMLAPSYWRHKVFSRNTSVDKISWIKEISLSVII